MGLEMKADGLCEAFVRSENKLKQIIENQNLNPGFKSLDLFQKPKSKLEQIFDESAKEIICFTMKKKKPELEN